MFYSHTFLARKGPLGTVWFAAHLQNKLKKSHYASTDIPSTVERIMFPEVPLALRMSGHLLLGVVRIYSKKVQFLYEDCNAVLNSLRKAFASIDLNLPEDARQAPLQAITLPETFYLDAMDLDDDLNLDGAHDHHLRSHEDITLIDQTPIETELYVSISFDEDIMMDFSHPMEVGRSEATAMDQEVVHPTGMNSSEAFTGPSNQIGEQNTRNGDDSTLPNFTEHEVPHGVCEEPGPSNREEMHGSRPNNDSSPEVPGFELGREAVHDSPGMPPVFTSPRDDMVEPQASLDQVMYEKETLPPIIEDNLSFGGPTPPFQPSSGPQASGASLEEGPMINNTSVSFAIQSTPPAQNQNTRTRKRKQFYDEAPVLTNKFMKKALEDPSNILCKRKKVPSSALGIWRSKNNLRKEQIFFEPSITGMCSNLCSVFNKDSISSKLQCLEEACPEPGLAQSPAPAAEAFPEPGLAQSPGPAPEAFPEPGLARSPASATEASPGHRGAEFQTPLSDHFQEIEHSRHVVDNDEGNVIPDTIPSPRETPSFRRDDACPSLSEFIGSTPLPGMETARGVFPTPDLPDSTRFGESMLDTPDTYLQDMQTRLEDTGLSDVPELNTADAEDLLFLEADNNTPTGSQGTQGVDSLSVRTRAVAQFLKRQSPITLISEDLSGHLSLNQLLQGKTRRLCARMFFETLVLKSNGLVDVQQEVPYGDITLKLTPELSKAQI